MKRLMDMLLSLGALLCFLPLLLLLMLLIRLTSKGPAIHWSERVGKNNQLFKMPKLRSMYIEAPDVATHLLTDSQSYITPIGRFVRKSSLDELPQLWSILKGDMSFVGPRPALHNQDDLIALRSAAGVDRLVPGLTGWAQVNGRDEIPNQQKVELDAYYLNHQSLLLDVRIIALTFFQALFSKGIQH